MLGITKEQLAELPLALYPGRPILIDNMADARSALTYLNKQQLLGFDTETRPAFRKGHLHKVALLQVATDKECFLFRINRLGFTQGMIDLFENDSITKVGLSIKDDIHQISKLVNFEPKNIIELQSFVKDFDIADNSLQKVYAIIFGERISKGQRLSNWEAEHLTEAQQAYASLDAFACLRIYRHLTEGKFNPESSDYILSEENNS